MRVPLVGQDGREREVLAQPVHVRHDRGQQDVAREGTAAGAAALAPAGRALDRVVGLARGDREHVAHQLVQATAAGPHSAPASPSPSAWRGRTARGSGRGTRSRPASAGASRRGRGRSWWRRSRPCRSCGSGSGSGRRPRPAGSSPSPPACSGAGSPASRSAGTRALHAVAEAAERRVAGLRVLLVELARPPRLSLATPARTWCTTRRLPGLKSTARIQRSSGRLVGSTKTRNSSSPEAASSYGSPIVRTRSGSPSGQSEANTFGGGASSGSPSGQPASTHFRSVATSASVSTRSSRNGPPNEVEAGQGGIARSPVTCAMSAARLRACS